MKIILMGRVAINTVFNLFIAYKDVRTALIFTVIPFSLISGFRRDVDGISVLLGYYAASCGDLFTDVSGQCIDPFFKGQESES
jgi:hypothetical protein